MTSAVSRSPRAFTVLMHFHPWPDSAQTMPYVCEVQAHDAFEARLRAVSIARARGYANVGVISINEGRQA
jgi:hypothetical protein